VGDRIFDSQRHFDARDGHSGAVIVALLMLVVAGLNPADLECDLRPPHRRY
jgi:hypothetical protein